MKRILAAAALLLPMAAGAAENQRTLCTHEGQERVIELVYPTGNMVPCEVHYTKDGNSEVLWNAQNETGYCENKAAMFVERQRGWRVSSPAMAKTCVGFDRSYVSLEISDITICL